MNEVFKKVLEEMQYHYLYSRYAEEEPLVYDDGIDQYGSDFSIITSLKDAAIFESLMEKYFNIDKIRSII